MSLHPYLFFSSGSCREAMNRYHEILGGELHVMEVGDMPDGEELPEGAPADMVIHAALTFGDGDLLMASDDPTGDAAGVKGAALNVTLTDHSEATRIFEALADGGDVEMPMGPTFWSPLFGACTDRFGVAWMVNVDGDVEAA